ncbi:MAG: hypothetical protein U9N33_08225 [Campylobacterota bacterium]|nr:hypothetical protein [Campylobacterota bacterium]
MKNYKLTFGEAFTARKFSIRLVKGRWLGDPVMGHKPQMNKDDASVYYTNKLRGIWKMLNISK